MSKELGEIGPVTHVAEVIHHGDKLLVPEGMKINDAIELLQRRNEYLEKKVVLHRTFDAFPWDGAYAMNTVIKRMFGWVEQASTFSFWGENPPSMVDIETDYNKKEGIPWGNITLPNIDGYLICDSTMKDGHLVFQLAAKVKRANQDTVLKIFHQIEEELRISSIYKGKVVRIRFNDDDGNSIAIPQPQFINPYDVDQDQLIYSESVAAAVETNLFTPICRVEDCLNNGIPVKRGVLLGGTYGTGKTLAAKVAAKLAAEHGITFLYVPRADELSKAIAFAKMYQSPACVVFCEDIDRVLDGERSTEMDDILNIIDGIDTKSSNIIVVLTTNELENINPAMLRPGRLDAVIEVMAPDAKAVEKLLRFYSNGLIPDHVSLERAGVKLEGTIPAVICEVIKRAKLAEIKRTPAGGKIKDLSEEAVLEAADTMAYQLKLLNAHTNGNDDDLIPTIEDLIFNKVQEALSANSSIGEIDKNIAKINGYLHS